MERSGWEKKGRWEEKDGRKKEEKIEEKQRERGKRK